jgi:hypothetical protein
MYRCSRFAQRSFDKRFLIVTSPGAVGGVCICGQLCQCSCLTTNGWLTGGSLLAFVRCLPSFLGCAVSCSCMYHRILNLLFYCRNSLPVCWPWTGSLTSKCCNVVTLLVCFMRKFDSFRFSCCRGFDADRGVCKSESSPSLWLGLPYSTVICDLTIHPLISPWISRSTSGLY